MPSNTGQIAFVTHNGPTVVSLTSTKKSMAAYSSVPRELTLTAIDVMAPAFPVDLVVKITKITRGSGTSSSSTSSTFTILADVMLPGATETIRMSWHYSATTGAGIWRYADSE